MIITVDDPKSAILRKKVELIEDNEFGLAKEIAEQLITTLKPYFPAAGLAAPQIGISRAVFIYSTDRTFEKLEVAVNPSFIPMGDEMIESWEGCFSALLVKDSKKIAFLPRYKTLKATYFNLQGEMIEKELTGYGAKVFQHEYDHLQGIVNIDRKNAKIRSFATQEELDLFFAEVKKNDSKTYK